MTTGKESLCESRPAAAIRMLDSLRGGLFTYSDTSKALHLEVLANQIRRADDELNRLLRHADQQIEEVRADLAANPRHYGTSE